MCQEKKCCQKNKSFPGKTVSPRSLSFLPLLCRIGLDLPFELIHVPLSLIMTLPTPPILVSCVHAQGHTHAHAHTHTHMLAHTRVCVPGRTCTCACMRTHTHTQALTHAQNLPMQLSYRCPPYSRFLSVPSPLHAWTHMYRHPLRHCHTPQCLPLRETQND